MNRALAGFLALGLGAGCGGEDAEFAAAPPTPAEIAVDVPGMRGPPGAGGASASGGDGIGSSQQALLGATADLYNVTRSVSTELNNDARSILELLRNIMRQPASSRTADGRIWGPFTPGGLDPLTYQVTVTRQRPGVFRFAIDIRARGAQLASDFKPMLDGTVTRAALDGRGTGSFTIHFDNRRALSPETCEQGEVTFRFDDTQPAATVDVDFAGFGSQSAHNAQCRIEPPHDASYHYDRSPGGGGNFTFRLQTNVHRAEEGKPALEVWAVRSRWLASGSGRADVQISGGEVTGDLKAQGWRDPFVAGTQCWNNSFQTIYETSAPPKVLFATAGDPAACAF